MFCSTFVKTKLQLPRFTMSFLALNELNILTACFPPPICQASRSTYRDYHLSDLKHLIAIETCDYFGMQTNESILIGIYNFGEVCGHEASSVVNCHLSSSFKRGGKVKLFLQSKSSILTAEACTHIPMFVSYL